jgi:hypothetical protein
MRRIPCEPNGNCLFIALYVAYERRLRKQECPFGEPFAEVSGTDATAIRRGSRVKDLIKEFYSRDNWSKLTPFGTRKEILCTELSCLRDLTDSDLEDYLKTLSWGSTPEYLAFALLANVCIKIYVPDQTGYTLRDSVIVGSSDAVDALCLVFDRQHYDVLVDPRPEDTALPNPDEPANV